MQQPSYACFISPGIPHVFVLSLAPLLPSTVHISKPAISHNPIEFLQYADDLSVHLPGSDSTRRGLPEFLFKRIAACLLKLDSGFP